MERPGGKTMRDNASPGVTNRWKKVVACVLIVAGALALANYIVSRENKSVQKGTLLRQQRNPRQPLLSRRKQRHHLLNLLKQRNLLQLRLLRNHR